MAPMRAHGATVHETLADAVKDVNYIYATTARPRGMIKEVITPEQAGDDMRARISRGERLAILFGRERWGLNNDEVSLADVIVTAPVNPAFASINIAQAVLLMGYEWFKDQAETLGQQTPELPALEGPGLQTPDTRLATKEELYGFFDHLERELDVAGFFKTEDKKPGMLRNIRNLFARAELTEQEVRSLRGMIASLTRVLSGWVSDRMGNRTRLTTAGYGMSGVGKLVIAVAGAWPVVLLGRAIDRFGKGVRTAPRDALLTEVTPPEMRGRAFGFHKMMDTLGAVLGVLAAYVVIRTGTSVRTAVVLAMGAAGVALSMLGGGA